MRSFFKSLSPGERFSAVVIAIALLGVMIPAAVQVSQSTSLSHSPSVAETR